jgi:hypothetical protein
MFQALENSEETMGDDEPVVGKIKAPRISSKALPVHRHSLSKEVHGLDSVSCSPFLSSFLELDAGCATSNTRSRSIFLFVAYLLGIHLLSRASVEDDD